MQFGGIIATDSMKEQEDKRVNDLSRPTPLKSGFGGIVATDALKKKVEKRKARFTSLGDKDLAQECPECEGFGYHFKRDSQLGENCSNCIQGWVIKDSDDVISTLTDDETFEKGVKLGAGMAVGFTAISIGFGLAAGIIGLAYQKATGE
tara:strand:+ start:1337 stop:1783 length:447 start_codon:yes stop_codon:yes gene_type:complete